VSPEASETPSPEKPATASVEADTGVKLTTVSKRRPAAGTERCCQAMEDGDRIAGWCGARAISRPACRKVTKRSASTAVTAPPES
jgi:hypothetical protein